MSKVVFPSSTRRVPALALFAAAAHRGKLRHGAVRVAARCPKVDPTEQRRRRRADQRCVA